LHKEYNRAVQNIYNKNTLNIIEEDFSKNINSKNKLIDTLYNKINVREYRESYAEIEFYNKSLILRDGSIVYSKQMLNNLKTEGLPIHHFIEPFHFSQARFELYENFIKHLLETQKNVILIMVPFYEQSYKSTLKKNSSLVQMEYMFIDIAKKNNLKVIGSYNPKIAGCEKTEFYDDMHPLVNCIQKILKGIN
jgi:hypothetical protein